MNNRFFKLIAAACIWSQIAYGFFGPSFIAYRPVGLNNARHSGSWQELRKDLFVEDNYCSLFSFVIEGMKSFDSSNIATALFGCNSLSFSGSRVQNRGAQDILADYFGLPTDFQSTLCFNPDITNIIADFSWYGMFSVWCQTFYVRLSLPLVHTSWDLNACENVTQEGALNYPAGYMSKERIDRSDLARSVLPALRGQTTFGDAQTPLAFGRVCGKQDETKLADVWWGLGWVAYADCNYYVALEADAVAPTGTRTNACALFEPQVGNGHHWALGGTLSAYANLWRSCDESGGLDIFLDATVQHLFGSLHRRSFDLKNGCGSRYMLIEDIGSPTVGVYLNDNSCESILNFNFTNFPELESANAQYHARLFHVIDKTTLNAKIKVNYQADVALKMVGYWCGFNALVGYNFFARGAESLVCRERLPNNQYAVKGDAQIYGYQLNDDVNISIAINATQSNATLHAGQRDGNANQEFTNQNADNARQLFLFESQLFQSTATGLQGSGVDTPAVVNGSDQAIFLSDGNINDCSGLSPRLISHKVFGGLSYTWQLCEGHYAPFIGIGGEAEFAGKVDCVKTAISQWGAWFEVGIAY